MRINSKDTLLGHPILKVREVIRLAMKEQLSCWKKEDIISIITEKITLPERECQKLFRSLIKEGYLEIENRKFRDKDYWVVTETVKGRHLGVTRANPLITRVKADSLLQELLERVKEVNGTKEYAYKVTRVSVFGSYLTDTAILGDLDVAIALEKKGEGEVHTNLCQKRIALALNKGRRFSNYVEEIFWPRREVLMHLSTRKKGLSMHIEGEDDVLERVQLKVVYKAN